MKREQWKQDLKRMKLDWMRRTSPGFFEASGGFTMEVKAYSDKTANGLTKAIIDFIKFNGGDANRINVSGTVRKIKGKTTWTRGGTRRGTADIHAIYSGRHLSIEIKIGRDSMSEYQTAEKSRIEGAGGLYHAVGSMPEFLLWFEHMVKKH